MSFGKDNQVPAQPNPALAIAAQSAANREAIRESARISAIDQFNPFGSVTFTRDDEGIPTSQVVSATPAGQQLINTQQGLANTLADAATTQAGFLPTEAFSLSGVSPGGATGINTTSLAPNATAGLPGFTAVDPITRAPSIKTGGDGGNIGPPRSVIPPNNPPQTGSIKTGGDGGNIGPPRSVIPPNNPPQTGSIKTGQPVAGGIGEQVKQFIPGVTPGVDVLPPQASNVEQAVFNREYSLLQPQMDRQRDRLIQDLSNRGIPIGSDAYNDALRQLDDAQGAQLQRLADTAVITGSQEAGRLFSQRLAQEGQAFGQGLSSSQLGLAARSQLFGERLGSRQQGISEQLTDAQLAEARRSRDINELLLRRSQPFNELSAFLQGSPALPVPQALGTPAFNVAPPDVIGATLGAANIANQAAANQQQLQSANLNGLFGLGGTLGAAALLRR